MDIRSITLFIDWPHLPENMAPFFAAAREAFAYPVQSARIASSPNLLYWTFSP